VQNLPDGRVEISVEGEVESVDRFERNVRHGPPGARVSDVQVDEDVPTRHTTGFSVR
jgi:acylphosphatase